MCLVRVCEIFKLNFEDLKQFYFFTDKGKRIYDKKLEMKC